MKAFEEWRKENTYSEICGHEWHSGAELAWRAALEWTENLFTVDYRSCFGIKEAINKELREN